MKGLTKILAVLFLTLTSSLALATTFNSPSIDGIINIDPQDWDQDELLIDDSPNDCRYPEADIDNVYATWDSTNFYIGVRTNRPPGGYGNGYVVFIDTDGQSPSITGATDFTNANFYPRRIKLENMGAEIMIGGWSFQTPFDVRYCSDPTKTQPVPGAVTSYNRSHLSFEVKIPWGSMFRGVSGVPAGTVLKIVVVSVGGDGSGAYDAAPNSSKDRDNDGIPDESDPDLAWNEYTALDRYLELLVDWDKNGIPDRNFPPTGYISGFVRLDDPNDISTVVTIDIFSDGSKLTQVKTPPGGGAYRIDRLRDGDYDLRVSARLYRNVERTVRISNGVGLDSVDFELVKVPGAIIGRVEVSGPPASVSVYAVEVETGEIGGDGVDVLPDGTGEFEIIALEDAIYRLIAEARGYVRFDSLITVQRDTTRIDISLGIAKAKKYSFIDAYGNEIKSSLTTRSVPDQGIFNYASLRFEPRDDSGNAAIFDSSALDSIRIEATLLDANVRPRGNVVFRDTSENQLADSLILSQMFSDGVAVFLVEDDSVEVLRVELSRGNVKGIVDVGVKDLYPTHISLAVDTVRAIVGEKIVINAQLLDASGAKSRTPGVDIRLTGFEGEVTFEPQTGLTDANGFFKSEMITYKAGKIRFSATVESGEFAGLSADTIEVTYLPDKPERIQGKLSPRSVNRYGTSNLVISIVDRFANLVGIEGISISISAEPEELLTSLESPVSTDSCGVAVAGVEAGDRYGIVRIGFEGYYQGKLLSADPVDLMIDPRLVSIDEPAPESDSLHNSHPDADLTTLFAWLERDTLFVMLDFVSTWDGMHLMVALETNGDAQGGNQDPFQFPIYYRHTLRPDYVFTVKYSSGDYADLRKWQTDHWEFWQLSESAWTREETDPGKNAISMVVKTDEQVIFKFPINAIGSLEAGDTIRVQSYVTQEAFGAKYSALDSNPHDQTVDMDGEWWNAATRPINLSRYATYVFPPLQKAPSLSQPSVSPAIASPDTVILLEVTVSDSGDGIGDVLVDLRSIGGSAFTRLHDDGKDGDQRGDDGIYSARYTIPKRVTQGMHPLIFIAKDSLNIAENSIQAWIDIINPPEILISAADSIGDDHGPNLTDDSGNPVKGLYYLYPTNGVFAPGVFDIHKVDIMIDGSYLVIKVKVGDIPASEAVGWNAPYPGATCANPNKADLNLQKIDIYIDSKEGVGATVGLPYRYVDIARNDAWEYAIAIEGWWKGLVVSNGMNSSSFWEIIRRSDLIDFCTDHVADYIEIRVALSSLGDPSPAEIKKWDFIVTMSSHDGDSNDQNFGAIRWVNAAVSEWQFGNGRDGEAGRERDPNIIDLITITGEGKKPGRTQEQMLNYLLPDALRRFENGLTACILEATSSEDISPPVIRPFPTDGYAHSIWYVLKHCSASFWTSITDQSTIDNVTMKWRPLGGSQWNSEEMVNIYEDYWICDIDPGRFESSTNRFDLIGGIPARAFEALIEAVDEYGNRARTPLLTFGVPDQRLDFDTRSGVKPGATVIFYDGTIITMPSSIGGITPDEFEITITPLGTDGQDYVDLSEIRKSMEYLGVGRRLSCSYRYGEKQTDIADFTVPAKLSLHYPTYLSDLDEKKIAVFTFSESTQRWLPVFGRVNEKGNAVTTAINCVGDYALFSDSRFGYDLTVGLSGVVADPNPFSPNGDGICDSTLISFFVSREPDWVTIEIYDIAGREVRTIHWQQGLTGTGRNDFAIPWDGRDDNGKIVPYGIYVIRVEVRFKIAPYNERQNIAVAVIK
ncbi:MAG: glucodextranase DOMON-like domain-containing protein [bacterium]